MALQRKTGVHTIQDLLDYDQGSVLEFGEDTIAQVVQNDLAALNAQVQEEIRVFVGPTVFDKGSRQDRFGVSRQGKMVKADEFGRPTAQKAKGGVNVGYPLDHFHYALGWTKYYLAMATPADLAQDATGAIDAYLRRVRLEIQRAIYLPTNYSFEDHLVDNLTLPVKRLLNADGAEIPNGPNGETFDGSSHTHYLANAGWDNAALLAAVRHLTEHGHSQGVTLFINEADEAAVSALTSFKELRDPRLLPTDGETLDTIDVIPSSNRRIGYFGSATVWVKPWAMAGFAFITALGDPRRPLKWRDHPSPLLRGLRLAGTIDSYPLRSEITQAFIGAGVYWRSNGVIMDAVNGSYTAPTLEN